MVRTTVRQIHGLTEPYYTLDEAGNLTQAKVEQDGMTLGLLDMDKFIRVNNLSEVTNPILLENGATFTRDGLLSQEIFGTSTEERRQRFAYIDLKTHYMYPLAASKLASYDHTLADCLYSRGRYRLADGKLVSDPDGESGPEFLYTIWPV